MAPDIRFVMNTAQGDTDHLSVQAPGDGIGNGGFTHAGRSHQAKNLGRHMGRQLPDSNGFQNPLLYLFQPEMVVLQNLGGGLDVKALLGAFVPGQVQHRIQIPPQDRGLGGAKGLLAKLLDIL